MHSLTLPVTNNCSFPVSGCILFLQFTSVVETSSIHLTVIPWKKTAVKCTIRSNTETSNPRNGLHKTSGKGPIGKMYIFLCLDRFFWCLFKFLKQVWTFHWGYVCISQRSRGSPENSSNRFWLEAVTDVANSKKRRTPLLKRLSFPIRALLLIVFDDGVFIILVIFRTLTLHSKPPFCFFETVHVVPSLFLHRSFPRENREFAQKSPYVWMINIRAAKKNKY